MMFDEWLVTATSWSEQDCYEAGQQSQQAKIDELQGRIDEALRHVVDHGGYDDLTHVISILKGNKDGRV